MKISKLLIISLFCVSIFMTGCGKEISIDEFELNNTKAGTENSVGTDDDIPVFENLGTLSHGVDWGDDEKDFSVVYEGGMLEIPYSMSGSGVCTSVGFLIFLDGIPQPYRIKDTNEEYKYMHVVEGEENEEKKFVISFVPVKGKSGDKVTLSINSIANPSFIPDMVSTFDYGVSHNSIEAVYDITFKQDAEIMPEIPDTVNILNHLRDEQTDMDEEEKKYIEERSLDAELNLDESVYDDLIMDENSMLIDRKMDLSDKDTVHVSYIMMGHPGVEYKVNFYLDHQLLTDDSGEVYEIELVTGKMNTIEFDMDVSKVNDGSFYVVAVPVNAKDYPDDSIAAMKYQSIHLYREEN